MLMTVYPRESDRACRDFRVKFPDEIIHDSLPGQLWFGAEVSQHLHTVYGATDD
ncbi:hypothetical protein COOONC_17128 [Cooperia oncophora]